MFLFKNCLLVSLVLSLAVSQVEAASVTECYQDVCATITVPDNVEPNASFDIQVEGVVQGGSTSGMFPYKTVENTVWVYDDSHQVIASDGIDLGSDNWNFNSHVFKSIKINRPAGMFTYTFVFGVQRWFDGYDVAVDATIDTTGSQVKLVTFDIKPNTCPNPFNIKSKGVLPAAIAGAADFDVKDIDPKTVQVLGVSPVQYAYEDITRPLDPLTADKTETGCTDAGPDGYLDLVLKFNAEDIQKALGLLQNQSLTLGEVVTVNMTAKMNSTQGGSLQKNNNVTQIEGQDKLKIITKNWQLRL